MTLDNLDWPALTQSEAKRLMGPANAREQASARRYDRGDISEAAWMRDFALWENMRVFVITGHKVADPFKMYND